MVVGNGENMWYLSQVKGAAEDDLVEGNVLRNTDHLLPIQRGAHRPLLIGTPVPRYS